MVKKMMYGVEGVAKAIPKAYWGVDGVARKIKKAYYGVGGVAKEIFGGARSYLHGGVSTFTHLVGDLTEEFISNGNAYTLDLDEFLVQVKKSDDVPLYVYLDGELVGTIESSGEQTISLSGRTSTLMAKGTVEVKIVSESTYNLGSLTFHQNWSYAGSSKSTDNVTCKSTISAATLSDNIEELYGSTFEGATFSKLDLPPSVKSIGQGVFQNCKNLTYLDLHNVESIGAYAFNSCHNLIVNFTEGLHTIGPSAFRYCHQLVDVVIPESVSFIGLQAFSDCNNLVSFSKTAGSASLGMEALYNCAKLTSAHIEGVNEIGINAFYYTPLSEVFLSDALTTIKKGAFYNTDLTSVTIPRSVTLIEAAAFAACTDLTAVTFKHTVSDQLEMFMTTDITTEDTFPAFYMNSTNMHNITIYHNGNPTVLNYDWGICMVSATFVQESL